MKQWKQIIAMLLCVAMLLPLTACGKDAPVKLTEASAQIPGLETILPVDGVTGAFAGQIEMQVEDITWEGEKGTARVLLTLPDFEKILSQCVSEALENGHTQDYRDLVAQTIAKIEEMIRAEDCPITTQELSMEAQKTTDKNADYQLITNTEFEKVISGNLEYLLFKTIAEGTKHEN